MTDSLRRIAIVGGSRIPFCRSNSIYSEKTNMDMLAAALQGLVDRYDLHGRQFRVHAESGDGGHGLLRGLL